MSESVLDFDEVAADDALIESLRAGADADDLVADDAVVGVLLSLRDGAEAEEEQVDAPPAVPGRAVIAGVITHRRSIAASIVAGIVATAGVGTAVAGDPTAAFTYLFQQGVELGGRLGSPESTGATGPPKGVGHAEASVGARSVPVRQGSAAAEVLDNGETRDPVGFQRGSRYWTVPAPRGLKSLVDNGGDSARHHGVRGFADTRITDRAALPEQDETPGPQHDEESTEPPDEHDFGTDTETDTTTEPPPDEGTTLIQPPPETTAPPPETTTPPPESTTPPPETTTSSPPETTTPPPASTTPPPQTTTSPAETTDGPPPGSSIPSPTSSTP